MNHSIIKHVGLRKKIMLKVFEETEPFTKAYSIINQLKTFKTPQDSITVFVTE